MDTKLIAKFNKTQTEIQKIESEILKATVNLQKQLVSLREQDTMVREAIKEAMEKNNIKKFEGDNLAITYIAPTVRKGIDTAKLKEEAPGIYDKYLKETPVKSSIRIKVG